MVVAGRTRSKVERTAATIAERGGTATALRVRRDRRRRRCRSASTATVREHGTVDILVNNAQVPAARARSPRSPRRSSRRGGSTGPLATFRFMRACHPHLKGGGVIVNMGSGSAIRPDLSAFGGYGACKEAIRTMSRAAACEWGRDGIRVNVVLPLAMSPVDGGLPRRAPRGARRRARRDPARVHRRCRARTSVLRSCGSAPTPPATSPARASASTVARTTSADRGPGGHRTMRAALYYGPGDVRLEDIPEPDPTPGTVKVRSLPQRVVRHRPAPVLRRAR